VDSHKLDMVPQAPLPNGSGSWGGHVDVHGALRQRREFAAVEKHSVTLDGDLVRRKENDRAAAGTLN
jgi:hypothetical protein